MNVSTVLMLSGVCMGFVLSLVIVLAIHRPFMKLLSELSRSEARGQFWATVCILCIFLIGVQAALPTSGIAEAITGKFPIVGLASQVRYSMIGLLASLVLISLTVVSYINRFEVDREMQIPWEDASKERERIGNA